MGGRICPTRTFAAAAAALALLTLGVSASAAADPPSLSIGSSIVTEGNSGTTDAKFTVTLSAASEATVAVDFAAVNDSAKAPDDYVPTSGTLTFLPNETTKTIVVPVQGDMLDESHETYYVRLSNAVGATIANAQGVGAILDNDPEPTVSVDDVTVGEGSAEAVFHLTLSGPSGRSVAIDYATADGTATAADDYAAASGTVMFAAGETSKAVHVAIKADELVEGDETFLVRVTRAINATVAHGEGTGTIVDDDAPPSPEEPPPPPDEEDPPPPPVEDFTPPAEDPPAPEANTAPDCSTVTASGVRFWPPNGKFRAVTLSGATDADGDAVTLEVVGVTQDEPTSRLGRGDRGPDAAWVAGRHDRVKVRAQRWGKGDGRVYRLEYVASDGRGGECGGTALVGVPHDARHRWHDSGPVYDSFAP